MSKSKKFGATCTPHMIEMLYRGGAWQPARLIESHDLVLAPQTKALHYGQSIFEGMKAFRQIDGNVALFRPEDHLQRLNRSAERMCIPAIDPVRLLDDISELVLLDSEQVPDEPDALYVRPLIFADGTDLIAQISDDYRLIVLLSPVSAYFQTDAGVRLCTESHFVRAVEGGTGAAKCAGNYAASFLPQRRARAKGYDEVLFLDAHRKRSIQETSSSNFFIVQENVLVTPPSGETVLGGITRDTLLRIAFESGLQVQERNIDLYDTPWDKVTELFLTGTAAGLTPVRELAHDDEVFFASAGPGPISQRLASSLADQRYGRASAHKDWRYMCRASERRTPAWSLA